MTKKVVAVLLLSGLLASNASAFKIPGADKVLPTNSADTTTTAFDAASVKLQIQNLAATSEATTQSYNEAIVALANAVSTKEQAAELKAKQDALTAKASDAEKNTIAGPVAQDAASLLEAAAQSEDLAANLKGLSKAQKANMANAGWNVLLANVGMGAVVAESSALTKTIAQNKKAALGMVGEVKTLKSVASNSATQVKQMAQVTNSVRKILTTAGVKVKEPKAATEKPVAVDPWAN